MSETITFPIDHFGVVSGPLFAQLLKQDGDKRKRKTAFNQIASMCKAYKLIPANADVTSIALNVDKAGQIGYTLGYSMPPAKVVG